MEPQGQELMPAQEQAPLPQTPQPARKIDSKIWVAVSVIILLILVGARLLIFKDASTTSSKALLGVTSLKNTQQYKKPKPVTVRPTVISTSTSNSQLDKDLQAIDDYFKNLDSDTQSIDKDLNDQQTNLE